MDWSFLGNTDQAGQFQMNPQLLQMMAQMGSGFGKGQSAGQAIGDATSQALIMKALLGQNPQVPKPTPIGQPGPDSVTTKQTADGTTMTVQTPSMRNLNTYGTSVPAEATPAKGGVSDQSPFNWAQLLGNLQM